MTEHVLQISPNEERIICSYCCFAIANHFGCSDELTWFSKIAFCTGCGGSAENRSVAYEPGFC